MVRFGDNREPAEPPRWLSDDGSERYGRFVLRASLILLAFYGAPTVAIFSVAPLGALVPDLLARRPPEPDGALNAPAAARSSR